MTDAEHFVWRQIRKKQFAGHRFRRQHPTDVYIVDFVCLESRLIVEIDGGQHAARREEDETRTERLNELGFRVLRFWNHDVFKEWDAIATVIFKSLANGKVAGETKHPPPCPPPETGGG
jgi:very-short-patch-repair endonuclease